MHCRNVFIFVTFFFQAKHLHLQDTSHNAQKKQEIYSSVAQQSNLPIPEGVLAEEGIPSVSECPAQSVEGNK